MLPLAFAVALGVLGQPARTDPISDEKPARPATTATALPLPRVPSPSAPIEGRKAADPARSIDSAAGASAGAPRRDEAGAPASGGADETLRGLPINLATALQLAGVRPLDIAAATAQVRQGLALLLQAKVLWVPTLNGGIDYNRHDGVQQNIFSGELFQKGRQSFFVGGGPSLFVGLADAIYEPLSAKRVVAARQANLQAARNDALLGVSQAYFVLQDARGRVIGAEATIVRARHLVDLTVGLSPGLIAPLEINRARAELESLRQTREVAIRDWRVASADLAEILLLEPETLLEPIEPPFLQVSFIQADQTAAELIAVALENRPEIASQRELLIATNQRLRQEQTRPFLPNLVIVSPTTATGLLAAGNLAAGPNQFMNENRHAANFEVAAVWQLRNGGLGNLGRIRQRRAEQDLAAIEVTRTLFRVRAEVSQALARLQTAWARVPQTEEGLRQATESADKNFIGLRETTRPAGELLRLVVRPQEVVAALIALNLAFEQYSAAVNEYNASQFALYRALGQPAQWITSQPGAPRHAPVPGPADARAAPRAPADRMAPRAVPAPVPGAHPD
jgi:outer membrane protein TolC